MFLTGTLGTSYILRLFRDAHQQQHLVDSDDFLKIIYRARFKRFLKIR